MVSELFTALCLLPTLTPRQLNLEAGKVLDRADNHKEEAELYESIAWDATLVQSASEFFSIVMSLPTTDPARYWDGTTFPVRSACIIASTYSPIS